MAIKYEIRLSGSGGQGIILASIIIAEAAVLNGFYTIQSQAYGPEARGGICKAEVIISDNKIWFQKVINPNFLLALTQQSLQKFSKNMAEDSIILMDNSLTVPDGLVCKQIIRMPILDTACTKVGKANTANIVAVSAINSILKLFPEDILERATIKHVPKGTESLNIFALNEGKKLIEQARIMTSIL
mgnify:CR=1 FL=1